MVFESCALSLGRKLKTSQYLLILIESKQYAIKQQFRSERLEKCNKSQKVIDYFFQSSYTKSITKSYNK